jgi:ribulose-5-phosphate 4-epimerase/fuculose-1-phosphate aldolase
MMDLSLNNVRTKVTEAEWQTRVNLAACYRFAAHFKMTDLIYTHISAKVPGADNHFLLNAFGLMWDEVKASNLVKVTLDGEIVDDPTGLGFNQAGFVIHSAIHEARSDVHCVMHTHTTAGVSVACLKDGLQQTNFYTAQLHNMIAYHDFEGITIHADEAPRLLHSMGNKQAVILRNHGLLSWGATLPQTFAILWTLQRACEIQLATFSMGGAQAVIPVSEDVAAKCTRDALQFNPNHGAGTDVLDALIRQVDRSIVRPEESYRL